MRIFVSAFLAMIVVSGYLMPSVLAYYRADTDRRASWVLWVNVLTGWTGIGWLVAFGMAWAKPKQSFNEADFVEVGPPPGLHEDIDTPPAEQQMDLTGDEDFPPPVRDNWL